MPQRDPLPVDGVLPDLLGALRQNTAVVLTAPPGSGKTTRVAPALMDSDLVPPGGQVWLLQPRRVAARASAERIAAEDGSAVGQRIGYQVRFERRVSAQTRLVVATEGVLLRRIRTDPLLEGIQVVVLDEFHERSINSDLLLAMLRRLQLVAREDLRIVVMSATLDPGPVGEFLGSVPLLKAGGQMYAVDIRYSPVKAARSMIDHVAGTVAGFAPQSEGDILVFLPGQGEIHGVRNRLEMEPGLRGWRLEMLYGNLPLEKQSAILRGSSQPRVILATNVAETSLTIAGIRTVIDSGLVRVLRFDPDVGLDRLVLEPVCQASAAQRAGRAGRTAEGVCVRLWDAAAHRSRPGYLEPEIRRVDVSSAILHLLACGEDPGAGFDWFEAPRQESIATAVMLLEQLGAIQDRRLTELGHVMARLPVGPRLARLLVAGHQLGEIERVSLAAALLSERDPFLRGSSQGEAGPRRRTNLVRETRWDCDLTQRVMALMEYYRTGQIATPFGEIHRGSAASIGEVAKQLRQGLVGELGEPGTPGCDSETLIQRALLAAMPDRLARRRDLTGNRALMVGGRGVRLDNRSGVQLGELFLCVDVDAGEREARVRQASSIDRNWLDPQLIRTQNDLFFAAGSKSVQQRRREYFADLILAETPVAISDEQACSEILFDAARLVLDDVLPSGREAISGLGARVSLLRQFAPELELPAVDESLLVEVLRDLCHGRRNFGQLREAPWMDWIRGRFSPAQWQAIERETPERIEVPTGNQIRIEYVAGKPPVLSVRIQEVFSWTRTPRIVFGRVPLLLHLLAPNMRTQQVTDDLESFWNNTYHDVRGELRRRYPKHSWPEDPLTAEPVSGVPRRK